VSERIIKPFWRKASGVGVAWVTSGVGVAEGKSSVGVKVREGEAVDEAVAEGRTIAWRVNTGDSQAGKLPLSFI